MIVLLATIFSTKLQAQTAGENIDVTHYEVRLSNFNFTDHTMQGEALITLNATASTSTIVLELKTLTVASVLCETTGIESFSQEADFLTISLTSALSAGQEITLDILYGGNTFSESWGGVEWWGQYVYNLGVGFDSQPHNLGKTWFPCVDNFVDKATYDLYLTVTNDKKAICGGNHINTVDNGDTSTWHWQIPQEVATYHPSFAIGDYVVWEDIYHGIERDIAVEVYVKPSQINSVPGTFVNIKEIAAFFEENFGPYPFNRIGYVCTSKGCMEHIDNIAITGGIITGNTTQEEYLAHELSHMYFGNKVTCSTAGDMWLNEGFAQFCGMFYRAGVYGEDNFQTEMKKTINTITTWCKTPSHWIPLNNIPLDMTYDSKAVYQRGAVVANTMMNYMGRENFLTGLRHHLETYAYSSASSEQLRDNLTEATGIDMSGFFDTYVFTAGMPHYAVDLIEAIPNGSQFDVSIRLQYQHVGPEHVGQNNRVEVTFVGAQGQLQTEMAIWDGPDGEQTLTIGFEPIAVYADYYNHFLDAKLDKNLTASSNATLSQGNLTIKVNNVTDSVMLRIEDHFIGPSAGQLDPAMTVSTKHYWEVLHLGFGDDNASGEFFYTNSSSDDGDIIQTQNDSAVLLYRPNSAEQWRTIPYELEGDWDWGIFTTQNLQSGQYTIGVIDKQLWSIDQTTTQKTNVYPVPTNGILHVITDGVSVDGEYRITSLTGQTMMTGKLSPAIDVSKLSSGTYFIIINGTAHKFIVQ